MMKISAGLATLVLLAVNATAGADYIEPPYLTERVLSGQLPAVDRRLPSSPSIVAMSGNGQQLGEYGGTLNTLMARAKDVRMMVVYGYARLVKFDRGLKIVPDILEKVNVDKGRVFTFHLRPGHKWSDGEPFTAEDFRYYWEDVANNKSLSPVGPPAVLLVDEEMPKFEVIDNATVRYTWTKPNPDFLPRVAGASPLYMYRPAHYLKKFHARYTDENTLNHAAQQYGKHNWAAMHNKQDNMYKNDNVKLPSLQPWINTTEAPSERFIFQRNPYFHRVDTQGKQLPYIDRVILNITSGRLIPAKAGTGESDLQARYLRFDNFTFLRRNETKGGFKTLLWREATGSHLALFPNLNAVDVEWRALLRDVRFRRALSYAINRDELNQVVYFGLAQPSQNTVLQESPLWREEYQTTATAFDISLANKLLNEIGLTERNGDDIRLLPSGKPLEIIVETAGESTEQADILELIRDSWLQAGVKLHTRPSQRDVLRNRIFSGETIMTVWSGLENGVPNIATPPTELAPTSQLQLQWPKWGQHVETNKRSGEVPDIPEAVRLVELLDEWYATLDSKRQEAIWHEMLHIHRDNLFTIGLVAGVRQPVVVNSGLRNVPREGVYNWDPGAHFGIYEPDTFWFVKGN
jgi:peptide/nickel transport system substrate-binding protein